MSREWLSDPELRTRAETMALCSSMVGLGAGLGIMWSYAALVKAGPVYPPDWIGEATAQLEAMLFLSGGVLAVGTAVMFALMLTDEDFGTSDSGDSDEKEDSAARTDGGIVEGGSQGSDPGDSTAKTTLQNRLRER